MSEQAEVTVTAPRYWVNHVEQLAALLSTVTAPVIPDPTGLPVDPSALTVFASPGEWAADHTALRAALIEASSGGSIATEEAHGLASGAISPAGDRLVLSVEEAAAALGISRAFAYEAVQRGEIPSIRIGRRILVPRAKLERFLNGDGPDDEAGQ
jgi:excisionase family DNA binding protein